MTFQQLQYLREVSKCSSINKAAQNLFISQTAISKSLKLLENELGVKLFIRTTKGVEFTEAGKVFLNYADTLLSQKNYIESLYRSSNSQTKFTTFSISTQRFQFILPAFAEMIRNSADQKYVFTYREENMDDVIDDVYFNKADVGIISISKASEKLISHVLNAKDLEFREVISVTPCVFCRRNHPLTKLEKITEDDLMNYPYIFYEQAVGVSSEFSEEYQYFKFRRPTQSIVTNSLMSVYNIICLSDAYTIGTGLLGDAVSLSDLEYSIPLPKSDRIRLGLVTSKTKRFSKDSKEFLEFLKKSILESAEYTDKLHADYLKNS